MTFYSLWVSFSVVFFIASHRALSFSHWSIDHCYECTAQSFNRPSPSYERNHIIIIIIITTLPISLFSYHTFKPQEAILRSKQAQLGVPHSRIQVELGFIFKLELARFSILLRIQDRTKVFKQGFN